MLSLLLSLCIGTGTFTSLADNLRVTSWNLQAQGAEAMGGTNDSIQRWATTLKELNPDVILLQGVRDWQMCAQLAQALKPVEFNVAVCSSFRPAQGQAAPAPQLAILSKPRAFFSWSAPAQTSGQSPNQGRFAFAAVQAGRVRLGFFCAAFSAGADPETQARPLLDQLDAVRRWEMNQVQSFVVGAAFGDSSKTTSTGVDKTVRLLEEAGFTDPLLQLPAQQRLTYAAKAGPPRATAEYLLAEPSVFPTPQLPMGADVGRDPITCDLELDSAKAAAAWTERARQAQMLSQARAVPGQRSSLTTRFGDAGLAWLAALGGLVLALAALIVALARTRKRVPAAPVLIPEHAGGAGAAGASYTVLVAPRSVTGSALESPALGPASPPLVQLDMPGTQTQSAGWQQRALDAEARAERAQAMVRRGVLPHLRRWLRQKLFRQLAHDRARLLETQQAVTRKALSVDERLSRIELQLQQQNRAYERRIEALTCELIVAKEENRELIRARIAEVKLEMEAARVRLLAQAEAAEGEA